eukprot:gnl/TRDRNA2_/TRDRNA2_186913_c0_seq1.p1 gnl/TRDRNA2_/TRDRNA2_186913_c0~~gnl/TRDRNA2_/TRDRNA2_186913_c0_seq1.p1  ORF type:complete len:296 (-),score=37.45 gnl/TRDRNA2_/TRDRNA2_186913_c0_seq1:284-1171(-)
MCDLEGEWVPTRHDEWYNNNPGKHRWRARAAQTKVTYDADGKGTGMVGEFFEQIAATQIAPGQYTASCKVGLWYAGDGNFTLLEDGTLEVRYPSNGIVEYWQRADGRGARILATAKKRVKSSERGRQQRTTKLVFRHFGKDAKDYMWHWALAVDDDVYEVAGWMAVMGPHGIVASNCLVIPYNTDLTKFHGYLDLPQNTRKTDSEIRSFIEEWVRNHPLYNAFGPNCQTFAEDLFTFLTGHNLPFAKFAERFKGADGPESDPRTTWLNSSKKPGAVGGSVAAAPDVQGSSACAVM